MRILVVKLTSMGDVLHLMPALTDLKQHHPEAVIDWMVEESFADIPAWHPAVDRTIKVATRRWRTLKWRNIVEFLNFLKVLRSEPYDLVIDAQGLIKSAVFARFAKLKRAGTRSGYSGNSIKESPAARLYGRRIAVERQQHAIERLRKLLAGALDYEYDPGVLDYGLRSPKVVSDSCSIMLFHGTTWATKHVPEALWHELAELANEDGYKVKLAWGNQAEYERAKRIATGRPYVEVLAKSSLTELSRTITTIAGAIAVDTGLGHMAAAFSVPCVSLYGATDANLTGALGQGQVRIQSAYPCSPCLLKQCPKLTDQVKQPPCYKSSDANPKLAAAEVWQALYEKIV